MSGSRCAKYVCPICGFAKRAKLSARLTCPKHPRRVLVLEASQHEHFPAMRKWLLARKHQS